MAEKEPIIRLLISNGIFDIHDEINSLYLPVDPWQALFFRKSPYSNPSMPCYLESFHGSFKASVLDYLNATQDLKRAEAGDKNALERLFGDLSNTLIKMRHGAETGALYVGLPYRPRTEELPLLFCSGYWPLEAVIRFLGKN